jgi:hypothetical protein
VVSWSSSAWGFTTSHGTAFLRVRLAALLANVLPIVSPMSADLDMGIGASVKKPVD